MLPAEGGTTGDRWLCHYAGWSLLAYLSKEQALGLALLGLVTAAWCALRGTARRRCLAAAAVSVGVAVVWLGWYKLAEQNMGPVPHASHSFGGMLMLLGERWPRSLMLASYAVGWPLGSMVYLVGAEHTWNLFVYPRFYRTLADLMVYVTAVWVTARRRPDCLVAVMAWKLCTYLPVLPLNDTWPWYRFMSQAIEPILLLAAIVSADELWDLRTKVPPAGRALVAWAREPFGPRETE